MEQWYTLHTKPNSEYRVVTALEQQDIQVYLPELPPSKAAARRRRPFFSCYLFARIDFEIVEFSKIDWMPGVRRVVSFDGQPVPLPDEMIDLIRQKLSELEGSGGLPKHSFKAGDPVRIKQGPFEDMVAIFDGPTTAEQRVQVLLNILGHARRVQLDVEDLEEADESDPPVQKRPRRTRGKGRRIASANSKRYDYPQF